MSLQKKMMIVDHPMSLQTFISEANIKKEHLTVVFFNIEKEYEITWKDKFEKDIQKFCLWGWLLTFIKKFLADRTFKIGLGSTLSNL